MQQIWLTELGWDDVLPHLLLQQWHEFLQDYPGLSQLRIPRWLNTSDKLSWELHGFCDASQKAYGAALYVRVRYDDQVRVHLLTAETRVAPVKTVSLPQFWTDSTIVLAWLNKPPCSWSTFVTNRVSSISKSTSGQSRSHVRSEDNPADLASRGVSAAELSASSLWWHGPDWLQRALEYWPTLNHELPDTQLEQRVQCHTTATTLLEDIHVFYIYGFYSPKYVQLVHVFELVCV
ncbi:uncharacterized protein [Drosophila tropicalis]|uniref:uncharacterized protein n=1 Tax=Drosophila tropicalis TaxID=46794 RepID=UPI0035ABAF5D